MLPALFGLSFFFLSININFAQEIGVNDDYYLNYPVSFSCPLPDYSELSDYNASNSNSSYYYSGDDYYGATLPAKYPAFVFFYVWMIFMTLFPLFYFAYNNKIAPIGQLKPFIPESEDHL